jgi:glycosyltransferase involved in cell wall biosynthesis
MIIAEMLESDGPGGAELVELRLAQALRDRGHVIVPVGPAAGCGWLAGQFRDAGFDPQTFTLRRPLDWRCLHGMIELLRAQRVDLVHSHEFTMAVYGAAAARWLGIPHIITMHGGQYVTAKWRRQVLLRWAFRSSAATVAVSQDTKRHLEKELGLGETVLRVVPNGVPARPGNRSAMRAALGIPDDHVLLLAVGSLVPRKGHAVLIEALSTIGAGSWMLAIAGGGAERERLEALAVSTGLSAHVKILGHREDVPDLLAATDVFVMPSLWEGLPLALLEAMLAGKPVIASRTSGIPEAVTEGVDGILTTPGDVPELANALRDVLTDAARRAAFGAAARARATAAFTLDAMTDGYEAVFREALGRANGRP